MYYFVFTIIEKEEENHLKLITEAYLIYFFIFFFQFEFKLFNYYG